MTEDVKPYDRADVRFVPAGDTVIMVQMGDAIDPGINDAVLALDDALAKASIDGVVETVPAYTNLSIHYDSAIVAPDALIERVRDLLPDKPQRRDAARHWTIPVCYGGELGPDLEDVAATHDLQPDEVVARHTGRDHRVYMLGFLPGFTFLGGLDPSLATERRPDPRPKIPPGSVGIGGAQTGIYSVEAPGGWQLLGRTPVRPYDPRLDEPFLFQPGDAIRFKAIDRDAYDALAEKAEAGQPIVEPDQSDPTGEPA